MSTKRSNTLETCAQIKKGKDMYKRAYDALCK